MTELQRNFWLTLAGRSVSKLGGTFNFLAMSLMIFAKTDSAMSVGQVMVATNLPMILLGPVIGVWVDRLNRRLLAMWCEIVRALLVLAIPFAPNMTGIVILAFFAAAVGFVSNTAQSTVVAQLFPREAMLGYNAKIQTAVQVMSVVGPVLAGIVIGFSSYTVAFAVDSATFLFSALTLALLAMPKLEAAPVAAAKEKTSFFGEMREGARYMAAQPRVMNAMVIMFTAMIVSGMFNVLFVVFSKDTIGVSDQQFGWLEAAIGVGLVLGAFLMNFFKKIDLLTYVRVGMILDALLIGALGFVGDFYTEWLVVVGFGICTVMAMIASGTIIQTETENAYMGRVNAFYNTVFMVGTVGSMALAGLFADWFDLRDIFLYGGVLTAAAIALLSLKRLPAPAPATAEKAE
jgi:MFS transporter, DHA3 family, macrolide efflux protein